MAYSRWFNEHGGSSFIVNHRLDGIDKKFPANKYFFLRQSRLSKAINYSGQLESIIEGDGRIDLYYSYGIPLPFKAGRVNWFHLSNVLPLTDEQVPLPLKRRLEMRLLGLQIRRCLKYADVVSAESESSANLFDKLHASKLFVSVNGSDDEISSYEKGVGSRADREVEDIAVAVGTYYYKCIDDVARIFHHLLESNRNLRLIIIGDRKYIPQYILEDSRVVAKGVLPQPEVCEWIRRSRYYITSTVIENSYNAASEGAFLARESFISDIGPHRELLEGVKVERLENLGTRVAVLHVKSSDLHLENLKSWDQVIVEMINFAYAKLT